MPPETHLGNGSELGNVTSHPRVRVTMGRPFRGGSGESDSRQSHKLAYAGSTPAPATNLFSAANGRVRSPGISKVGKKLPVPIAVGESPACAAFCGRDRSLAANHPFRLGGQARWPNRCERNWASAELAFSQKLLTARRSFSAWPNSYSGCAHIPGAHPGFLVAMQSPFTLCLPTSGPRHASLVSLACTGFEHQASGPSRLGRQFLSSGGPKRQRRPAGPIPGFCHHWDSLYLALET